MGRAFEVFLPDHVDVWAILAPLGWERSLAASTDLQGCEVRGRDWEARVWDASPMSWEDAPPEAVAMQAGIAWHVDAALEGSEKGLSKMTRALRAIAKAGHGVIADEDEVWRPGSPRRTRWSLPLSPLSSEAGQLTMGWWTVDPAITTYAGAAALVETLARVLPEAMPARWGEFDPPSLSFEAEGAAGLATYISAHLDESRRKDGWSHAKVRPPFSTFSIVREGLLVGRQRPVPGLRILSIEAGASVLRQPGWGRQLAVAFSAISEVLRPFYGEARLDPLATWDHGWHTAQWPPTSPGHWWGFPHTPPMAMVVGPPYTTHWHRSGGVRRDDLVIYSGERWPDPPPGGVPVATPDLLQEFDPWFTTTEHRLHRHFPMEAPATWPFLPSEVNDFLASSDEERWAVIIARRPELLMLQAEARALQVGSFRPDLNTDEGMAWMRQAIDLDNRLKRLLGPDARTDDPILSLWSTRELAAKRFRA